VFEARHSFAQAARGDQSHRAGASHRGALRRFDLEAKTTSELCHPNTVVVFGLRSHAARRFFTTPWSFVNGITWEHLVHEYGAQPASRVRHLLLQACGSLSEAHGLGLVHRDVKPGNLMLGVNGGIFDFVKVLDFGLVRVTRGAEKAAPVPACCSARRATWPQRRLASSHSGPRADIYALGCVAYFLLAGQEPFTAKTDAGIAMLHLTQTPASLKGRGKGDITDGFERVVMRCLAKSPDDRFASAAQLMRALSELQLLPWTQADAAAFWADFAAAQDARQALEPAVVARDQLGFRGRAAASSSLSLTAKSASVRRRAASAGTWSVRPSRPR